MTQTKKAKTQSKRKPRIKVKTTPFLCERSFLIAEVKGKDIRLPVSIRRDFQGYGYYAYYGSPIFSYDRETPTHLDINEMFREKDRYRQGNYVLKALGLNVHEEVEKALSIKDYEDKIANARTKNKSPEMNPFDNLF